LHRATAALLLLLLNAPLIVLHRGLALLEMATHLLRLTHLLPVGAAIPGSIERLVHDAEHRPGNPAKHESTYRLAAFALLIYRIRQDLQRILHIAVQVCRCALLLLILLLRGGHAEPTWLNGIWVNGR